MVADLVADANAARPITAGGTGAATASAARIALGLAIGTDIPSYSAGIAFPPGHLQGLTLSNNSTDATNDIDIAAGSARDSTDAGNISLASAITKRLDAAWAVGSGNGGLDTGSIANTTYHVHLIKRVDTGVVDVLFSLSASAPTMPTNYTLSRRIGSILRESAAMVGFVQTGNTFMRKTPVLTINSTNPGTSAVTRAMSVPTGIVVEGIFGEALTTTAASTAQASRLSALSEDDVAPSGAIADILYQSAASGSSRGAAIVRVQTDTSGQIRSRLFASDAGTTITIVDMGWVDRRGQ